MRQKHFFKNMLSILTSEKIINHAFISYYQKGLLKRYFPHCHYTYGFYQNKDHQFDLFQHTLMTVNNIDKSYPYIRIAALFHDLGKINTRSQDKLGNIHFFQHQFESQQIFNFYKHFFELSKENSKFISLLIKEHMLLYSTSWSDKAVKRFIQRVGFNSYQSLLMLCQADNKAKKNSQKSTITKLHKHLKKRVEVLYHKQ